MNEINLIQPEGIVGQEIVESTEAEAPVEVLSVMPYAETSDDKFYGSDSRQEPKRGD